MGDTWLIVSMSTALTVMAAGVLPVLVLPRQEVLVEGPGQGHGVGAGGGGRGRGQGQRTCETAVQLGVFAGVLNLLWATVTVLRIVRPGSTTGV